MMRFEHKVYEFNRDSYYSNKFLIEIVTFTIARDENL